MSHLAAAFSDSFPKLLIAAFMGCLCQNLAAQQLPYGGTAIALPGTIEFERYDQGGAGIAFYDVTPTNTGNSNLRGDAVDLNSDSTASGGLAVQNAAVGEWLEYTVAPSLDARSFVNLTYRYKTSDPKQIRLLQDGVVIATTNLSSTNGAWGTTILEKIPLTSSASSVLRVEVTDSGANSLIADKTGVTAAEQWDVIDVASTPGTTDSVAFRSALTGKFLRQTSKDHAVYADGTAGTTTMELFTLGTPAAGVVSLRSRNAAPNDTWLSVPNSTTNVSPKSTSDASNTTRFTVVDGGPTPGATLGISPVGRRIALKNVQSGTYLSISNNSVFWLDSLVVSQWINRLPAIDQPFNRTALWPANSLALTAYCQEFDPSGSIVARTWRQISGPTAATIGDLTTTGTGKETTTATISGLQPGAYVFRFSATDDTGDTSTRDVDVAIVDPTRYTIIPANDSRLQIFGRVYNAGTTKATLGWNGGGIRLRFQSEAGGSISAQLTQGSWPGSKQMFYVILDGDDSNPRIIDMNGATTVSHLVGALPAGIHTLELYAISGAWVAASDFSGVMLSAGVTLLDPPIRTTRRIEFYGDSITEGYLPDKPFTCCYWAFGAQAARKLGAEANIMARSGLGLVFTNNGGGIPLEGLWNRSMPWDGAKVWNFDNFKPQVIVVNILQNDKWLSAGKSTDATFTDAYVRFLRLLRAQHPNAHVICALGAMDAMDPATPQWPRVVSATIAQMRTEDHDEKLHAVFFPWLGAGTGHPNQAQSEVMATQLADYVNTLPLDVWADGQQAPAGYQAWLGANGLVTKWASEAQPFADADGDGTSNLLEYALGTDPKHGATSAAGRPALSSGTNGSMTFRFPRAASDLTYTAEWSSTLGIGEWNTAPWPVVDLGGGMAGVTVPAPVPDRFFMRLNVSIQP